MKMITGVEKIFFCFGGLIGDNMVSRFLLEKMRKNPQNLIGLNTL
jgi:hypothetical protein